MATAGPSTPGTQASDNGNGGTVAWSDTGNVTASDNSYATAALLAPGSVSEYLKLTNFGFTIPAGATINGITVAIERKCASALMPVADSRVRLVKAGTVQSTDKASGTTWPDADAVATYGGEADVWSGTWTADDINSSGFGVAIAATSSSGSTASIDHVTITITYTLRRGKLFLSMGIKDAPTKKKQKEIRMRFLAGSTGFQQITGLSAKQSLTVPANAKAALIQATDQNVRWRADGTDPTASVGMLLYAGDPPTLFTNAADGESIGLDALEFIEVTTSAKLNVVYLLST